MRLWLERHHRYPAGRRRLLVFVLSALVAMALGAGVTLAITQRGPDQNGVAAQRLRTGIDRAAGSGG